MARSEARISVDIWAEEDDFVDLGPGAQRMYLFLLSQVDLAHTGVLALRVRRWSRAAARLTPEQVSADLAELEADNYVVVDQDTEEVLIRSFLRRDKVYRQPNVLLAAKDQLPLIASQRIRDAITVELDRIVTLDDVSARSVSILDEMRDMLKKGSGMGSRNPSEKGSANPSRRGPGDAMGSGNPSGNPSSSTSRETVDSGALWDDASVSAGDKGSGNPSENPSGNPSRTTPGDRGVVTAVSSASPNPYPQAPKNTPRAHALARDPDDDPDFVAFWDAYPRKVDKGHARKAWAKAIKAGFDPAAITAGAEAFAQQCQRQRTEQQYIPHAATWLNGERWNDRPAVGRAGVPGRVPIPSRDDPHAYDDWLPKNRRTQRSDS